MFCDDDFCAVTNRNHWEKTEENPYANLPAPPTTAKRIHLKPDLKADTIFHKKEEISIRECLLIYAKESESKRERAREQNSKRYGKGGKNGSKPSSRVHVKSKTPVLGSEERKVMRNRNYGFFSTIWEAYDNHYSLRTCVDDWWYTIVHKIALAVDDSSGYDEVRNFFVSHEGKKTLTVEVGTNIYGVDYSWFLDQMTQQISENIKVPNYVDLMKADYSTSTKTHVIVSEVSLMASVQEYFVYEMGIQGCGIPSLEMEGKLEDWKRMKDKLLQLKDLLKPIHRDIRLSDEWWDGVEKICDELINAFNGKPDTYWWSRIFTKFEGWGSGPRSSYDGWFISQLLGLGSIECLSELEDAIVTVPMVIIDKSTGVSEDSAFAAGIAGFEMFKDEDSSWASVKAVHGWALMLEPDSALRDEMTKWESKLVHGA